MRFEAYFDESGDDGGFPLMLVGGYVTSPEKANVLDRKWSKLLKKHGLTNFHMVECAHGNKQFAGMGKGKRVAIQSQFFELINENVEFSVASCAPLDHFEYTIQRIGHPYSMCLNNAISAFSTILDSKIKDWTGTVFYEHGHRHSGEAKNLFEEYKRIIPDGPVKSLHTLKKQDSGMIQAADVFAWQFSQYVKGPSKGKKIRWDFENILLKKPGMYMHCFPYRGIILTFVQYNDGLSHPDEIRKIQQLYSSSEALHEYVYENRATLAMIGGNRSDSEEFLDAVGLPRIPDALRN